MLKDISPNELIEVFQYKDHTLLSFAIILSALSLGKSREYFPVQTFRENPFSELWRKQFHHGSNWTAQYRSELNQGENRLAYRVFESPEGDGRDYRLKNTETLTNSDKAIVEEAKNIISALEKGDTIIDSSDETFQTAVRISEPAESLPNGPIEKPKKRTQGQKQGYKGNPKISKQALIEFGNKCLYDSTHKTFYSPTLNDDYVEMHHIIPISKQDNFEHSIDLPANIVPLCPNCHRQIHHSNYDLKSKMLEKLYTEERIQNLKERGIVLELKTLQDYY